MKTVALALVGVLSVVFAFKRWLLDLGGCSWYNNLVDKSEYVEVFSMGNEIGELIMEVSKKRFDEAGGVLYTFSLKRGF
jgi:hypothetical protein